MMNDLFPDFWNKAEQLLLSEKTSKRQLKIILSQWASILNLPNANTWDREKLNYYTRNLIRYNLSHTIKSFSVDPGLSLYQVLMNHGINIKITDTPIIQESHIPVSYRGEEDYFFISYSHKNNELVFPFIQKMQSDGYRVWFDEGIRIGSTWTKNIADHIDCCMCFIALVSPEYFNSDNCTNELHYANEHTSHPILIVNISSEDFKKPNDFLLQHDRKQAITLSEYSDTETFWNKLYGSMKEIQNHVVNSC